jgi:hypothetical protein
MHSISNPESRKRICSKISKELEGRVEVIMKGFAKKI